MKTWESNDVRYERYWPLFTRENCSYLIDMRSLTRQVWGVGGVWTPVSVLVLYSSVLPSVIVTIYIHWLSTFPPSLYRVCGLLVNQVNVLITSPGLSHSAWGSAKHNTHSLPRLAMAWAWLDTNWVLPFRCLQSFKKSFDSNKVFLRYWRPFEVIGRILNLQKRSVIVVEMI